MTKIVRVGLIFPTDLLEEFDETISRMGYNSRSKAIQNSGNKNRCVSDALGPTQPRNLFLYARSSKRKRLPRNYRSQRRSTRGRAEEFYVKVAHNTEEACELVGAGFEYVTGEYNDGGKIFRKRK